MKIGQQMKMKYFLLCTVLALVVVGCQNPSSTRSSDTGDRKAPGTPHAAQLVDPLDQRTALPLLPRMAAHQRENMRDHLAAVQEIIAAVSAGDFAGVERSAARIGYSEQMGQMCSHMGSGAPGFTQLALNFHHTADTIVPAAKARDTAATLKALSATVKTCVGCHAIYRQHLVDEATWKAITGRPAPTPARP
jgi:hypothetical protein